MLLPSTLEFASFNTSGEPICNEGIKSEAEIVKSSLFPEFLFKS